jgi:cyclopropane fatty-acyl-phospholipid synthase-like methyltransferase
MEDTDKKEELKQRIKKHLENQEKNWEYLIYGKGMLYQSFNKLGINGQRNTEKRMEEYELKRYLKKTDNVLDIGCNCGFICLQISDYVASCDGIEINPYLVKIAEEVKEYLNNINTNFHTTDFKDYNSTKKYNAIFSFAADEVADDLSRLSFEEYLKKILSLIEKGGYLFFEFQALDMVDGNWKKKYDLLQLNFNIIKEKKIYSSYPSNVKERIFLILKEKS